MNISSYFYNHWLQSRTALFLLASMLIPCPGCGDQHGLAQVEGVVHLEGTPMQGGKVLLTPLTDGKPAAGKIQPDGSFVLSTYRPNDGAIPGKHRLLIAGDSHAQTEQARASWIAPKGTIIEIETDKENRLKIDVKTSAGWTQMTDD